MSRIIVLVAMILLGGVLLVGLPHLRSFIWGIDGPTIKTSLPYDPEERAAQESAVAEAMKVDTSRYDRTSDIRYIEQLPISETELEALFRQRKGDVSEKLLPGDFVVSQDILVNLTPRDLSRPINNRVPSTRRPVLSIALNVAEADRPTLPTLSRSQILSFLNEHFVSLQARVSVDQTTQKWRLNYRPIACQSSMGRTSRIQRMEPTVEATVNDVRGLGMLQSLAAASQDVTSSTVRALDNIAAETALNNSRLQAKLSSANPPATLTNDSNAEGTNAVKNTQPAGPSPSSAPQKSTAQNVTQYDSSASIPAANDGTVPANVDDHAGMRAESATGKPQTAVWLFRSEWMEPGTPYAVRQYEYVFIHARPIKDLTSDDPWELHTVITTDQRRQFHYYAPIRSGGLPSNATDANLVANIHFTKYANGGLVPAGSVTRSVTVRADKSYSLTDVQQLLAQKTVTGSWTENPEAMIEAIVEKSAPK